MAVRPVTAGRFRNCRLPARVFGMPPAFAAARPGYRVSFHVCPPGAVARPCFYGMERDAVRENLDRRVAGHPVATGRAAAGFDAGPWAEPVPR